MLTQAILKEKLHYSIITGEFYWLKPKQGVKTDNVAGALNLSGHRKIMVNGKLYYAHRLAWFYCTGEFPKHEIDHKNGRYNGIEVSDITKQVIDDFQPLNRQSNLQKRSSCNLCKKTNKRFRFQIYNGP